MERIDRVVIAVFVGAVVLAGAVVGAVIASSGDDHVMTRTFTREPGSCRGVVDRGVLPRWARTGFSDPRPRMPHVVGRDGELAAIIFGEPLTAPPRPDRSNKILWVARRTPQPGPLRLTAEGLGGTVRRVVESGPGPSIVDLPAGCWIVTARWPGGEDELELSYAPS